MPLVGGGGAGNIAGSAGTAGTGKGLNIVRTSEATFAYVFSGIVPCDNNATTLINFTSGNELIEGKIQIFYSEHIEQDMDYTLTMNGEVISKYFVNDKFQGLFEWCPILIPPYTNVLVTAQNIVDTDKLMDMHKQLQNATKRMK
jgi:hypothetical protein